MREQQAMRNPEDRPQQNGAGTAQARPPLCDLFGRPAFMPEEAPADYDALYEEIRRAAAPSDGLEEIWVRDVVDEVWQVIRMKRIRIGFLHERLSRLLTEQLEKAGVSPVERQRLLRGWSDGDVYALAEIELHLRRSGDNLDALAELAFAQCRPTLRCLDQMITGAESRRAKALRAIGRHRESLGQRLRAATENIEDTQQFGSASSAEGAG